ncbi:MAG TPA: hypothetical protein DCM05_15090 [Elusimicrobia bacterium]|nr:hypothetical protein [Elusimicrobiota bacterium]
MRRSFAVLAAAAALGCVDLEPGALPQRTGAITRASFGGLDPGAKIQTSLHFEVRAYGADRAQAVSEMAERSYQRIMQDTGLYSFMPREPYPIVLYAGKEEFLRKTGMPEWSAGAAVGNSIYSYESRGLPGVLAHEMTHLVFNEYMGRSTTEHRWINEGLAVYEEYQALQLPLPSLPSGRKPLPFAQMVNTAPLGEERSVVDLWYAQALSVVRFLIERGGRMGLGQLLSELRSGRSLDDAIRSSFSGVWTDFAALEKAWLSSGP